jgi:pyruvate dehydrogenase E1 component
MAMVVRANRQESDGIGGHISTYASSATLYEVASTISSVARRTSRRRHDLLPGPRLARHLCARLCGRPPESRQHLENFRRELRQDPGGLSSYPHPWLMPDFWQFPTVSMGLGPIMAIYQARFNCATSRTAG